MLDAAMSLVPGLRRYKHKHCYSRPYYSLPNTHTHSLTCLLTHSLLTHLLLTHLLLTHSLLTHSLLTYSPTLHCSSSTIVSYSQLPLCFVFSRHERRYCDRKKANSENPPTHSSPGPANLCFPQSERQSLFFSN
jgi:hypothetical protein